MKGNLKSDEFGNKVYHQLMDIWIAPSIKKRQESGDLPSPLNIRSAQIIFCPDNDEPIIHVNDEIKVIASVKLKESREIKEGEPITHEEIEKYQDLKINKELYPNCGHATFIIHNGALCLAFDFTRYRFLAKQHLSAAKQFIQTARFSLENKYFTSFVDTLFSAKELIAKSILLRSAESSFAKKTNHKAIHCRYNKFGKLGQVEPSYIDSFNQLSCLRSKARYLNDSIEISDVEANKLLANVQEAYEFAEEFYNERF
jgi:hypothetical protein